MVRSRDITVYAQAVDTAFVWQPPRKQTTELRVAKENEILEAFIT
jgi:hypothetical protein